MVFAILTVSKLLTGVRQTTKIIIISHAQICFFQIDKNVFNNHKQLKRVFITFTKSFLLLYWKFIRKIKNEKPRHFRRWGGQCAHTRKKKTKNHSIQKLQNIFHEQSFNFELNNDLLKINNNNAKLKKFKKIILKVLDKHAPKKTHQSQEF